MQTQRNQTLENKRKKAVEQLTNNESFGNLSAEEAEELVTQLELLAEISLRHLIGENKQEYEP